MTQRRRRARTAVLAGLTAVVFAVLATLVALRWPPLMDFDEQVVVAAVDAVRNNSTAVRFWQGVAVLFGPWLVRGGLLLLAVVLYLRGLRRTAIWLGLAAVLSLIASSGTKLLIHRPRPVFAEPISVLGGYAFPSGHATAAGMSATVLAVLAVAVVRKRWLRSAVIGTGWALAVLVALDRVLLGVHYLSDVVGGLLLGSFTTLAVTVAMGDVGVGARRTTPSARPPDGPRRRLGVVLNPVGVDDAAAFKRRVSAAARGAGWEEPLWFETTVEEAGGAMGAAALAAGADVVAVAGGDGTVRTVCAELARTGVPVGIIPTGTGNLLARNLGLPLTIDAALAVVFAGHERAIDMVRVEGDDLAPDHFVVMAGLGLDAAIMAGAPEAIKAKVGWPAYVIAALRHIRYPAVRMDISVDDAPYERFRARTVVIGNVGNLQAGIPLLPQASFDDGRLDVVVIAPRRSLGWFVLLWRVLLRRPHTDERLGRMTGRRVVVQAGHPAPRQLDGDPVGEGSELRAEVAASVLLVRVPR